MAEEGIELSARERERLKTLHEVEQGHLKQVDAARRLRLTDRHVRRLQDHPWRKPWKRTFLSCEKPDISTLR